jgi:hypothetical protein
MQLSLSRDFELINRVVKNTQDVTRNRSFWPAS